MFEATSPPVIVYTTCHVLSFLSKLVQSTRKRGVFPSRLSYMQKFSMLAQKQVGRDSRKHTKQYDAMVTLCVA